MIRKLLFILAVYFFATGLYIFFAPQMFYDLTPGLSEMGPFNFHFIRDVALVFLASGGALFYAAKTYNRAVAICAAAWPFMHGLFHLQIWSHRGFPFDQVWAVDSAAVILPGFLVLWLAYRFRRA